ncbi:MAG: aminopeptidase P family protein [Nitrospinaceae bacterium]|nr:aminopeptidase P family protein [Nitrospinaceae bacterium]MBT3435802.1 aminopeptidase P family protein [Nitrospinaceae bacterium]MBT3821728.1 aminopeptidase P family protein [Nitrospinaceae bacterium]MBT4428916.1 aminopeptidase P family protein [Nitrospinaceae bacterium]MBT5366582.1 aminopeptidase P family protein [Nitrospinaceae bacterium]
MGFSLNERDRRYQAVRVSMETAGLDALIVYGSTGVGGQWRGNFSYLTDYCPIFASAAVYFPLEGEPVAFIPGENQLLDARRPGWIEDMRLTGNPVGELCAHVSSLKAASGKIGISSFSAIPSEDMNEIRGKLSGAELVDGVFAVFDAREKKSEEELEAARRGARVGDLGWRRSLEILRPGLSEFEWKAELERVMTAEGADGYFNMLGAGRPDAGRPDEEDDIFRGFVVSPTARKFQKGDLALLEITPRVEGYWNQVVRLVSFGEPPEYIQKAHEACLDAKRVALAQIKTGETFTSVAEVITEAFEKHGYPMKGVGSAHTTGLDLSESIMNLDNKRIIEPGLLLTVHPMTATGDWRQLFVGESYFLHADRLEMLNDCDEEIAVVN